MRLVDADSFREWILKQTRLSKSYTLATLDEMPTIDPEPKKGEWILTKDRKPQQDTVVLVTFTFDQDTKPTVFKAHFDGNLFYIYQLRCEWDESRVPAWMPLPRPYANVGGKNDGDTDVLNKKGVSKCCPKNGKPI